MKSIILSTLIIILASCSSTQVISTPNLILKEGKAPFLNHDELPETKIFYITDRQKSTTENEFYSNQRSYQLKYGKARIQVHKDSKQELYNLLTFNKKKGDLKVDVTSVDELGTFPDTAKSHFYMTQGQFAKGFEASQKNFIKQINEGLKGKSKKDIYLFVHGYNNAFNYAATRIAQLWFFMGHQGLPMLYSWPAGQEGLFGYFADKESGEFSILNLKKTLEMLAKTDVENIHLIAHSRGTEISLSALRELHIKYSAMNIKTKEALKLTNLILAAPDIDIDIFKMRFVGENIMQVAKHVTIYLGQGDKALKLSTYVHKSLSRLGIIKPEDVPESSATVIKNMKNVDLIYVPFKINFLNHSYFLDNPAVSSDIILLLRDDVKAGHDKRPLEKHKSGIWLIHETYPLEKKVTSSERNVRNYRLSHEFMTN